MGRPSRVGSRGGAIHLSVARGRLDDVRRYHDLAATVATSTHEPTADGRLPAER